MGGGEGVRSKETYEEASSVMQDGGSLDHSDGGGHGEEWSDYGYILKRDPTVGLSVDVRREVSRVSPKILP